MRISKSEEILNYDLEVATHSILVPGPALQVLLKVLLDVEHFADVTHAEGLALIDGEGLGRADGVLDLAAVEVMARQAVEVVLVERHQVDARDDARALDENLEDGLLRLDVQVLVP